MIIVSQDKGTIVNFRNIQNIKIEPYGTHIKGKKIYKIFSGNFEGYEIELGTYETEERAKEVLQEIGERYEGWQNLVYGQPSGICSPRYEMPED